MISNEFVIDSLNSVSYSKLKYTNVLSVKVLKIKCELNEVTNIGTERLVVISILYIAFNILTMYTNKMR